ncbi:phage tail sheath C-terminal domain-containing protein [Chitinivorax sp. B]|uniref:phage tail sheath C-terminal domain-containing protein n=1 Tax=Chitinivorax sp. B TaxID=2502235 RepID=UPI0010F73F3A|nr:phage tail sheath C-terminal domain-containing protein [Chitinivorax sp. B]
MLRESHLNLGAPGLYTLPPEPIRQLTGQRMDVCAFVGVAPRGPCRVPCVDQTKERTDDWRMCDPNRQRQRSVPQPVESFDEYRRLYGGFEGPGLLPYAVAGFFEQGGRRAYIVRIVHDDPIPADPYAAVAKGQLAGVVGTITLHARNEGAWGNQLQARLRFQTRPLQCSVLSADKLQLNPAERIERGSLLRLRLGSGQRELRFVANIEWHGDAGKPHRHRVLVLELAASDTIERVELVEASLLLDDGVGGSEQHSQLGLHVDHPRWLATVLCRESTLVWPDMDWAGQQITPQDAWLRDVAPTLPQFKGGVDRYIDLIHADFFDDSWLPDEEGWFSGIQSLAALSDLTQLVVPDLYQPAPLPPNTNLFDPSLAGPEFADCVVPPPLPISEDNTLPLQGLTLEPSLPGNLDKIIKLQIKVTDFTALTREHIALLDVPPGLTMSEILRWRSHFDTAFAAAYHPWLTVSRSDDARDGLVKVPPSGVAAGVIAARELRFGVPTGPANELAMDVVKVAAVVAPKDHDRLHPLGINVYLQEQDGVRLTAARTLALDPQWRQLSVRRLILMLRRTLNREMQWAVFEPNTPALRRELVWMINNYLGRLFSLGAFKGGTEQEAFFVRCDDVLNPPYRTDNGQLVCEVGVAPAEPIEFIVLRILRDGDGTLLLEER